MSILHRSQSSHTPAAPASRQVDLFVCGDTHCNSKVGLLAPDLLDDEGAPIAQSRSQAWLWARWLEYVALAQAAKAAGRRVFALALGDLVDCNIHDGFQLHEPLNQAVMLRIAEASMRPLFSLADRVFVLRGTPAHTGGAGYLEELLAQACGPQVVHDSEHSTASWWLLEAEIGGVRLVAQHHPGTNSMRPWTQGGAANRLAAMLTHAYYGAAWTPELALFGHIHHSEDSYDNHPVRAVTNRAWKLADVYEQRSGRGYLAREVGGMIVHFDGDGGYNLEKVVYTLPRPQPWHEEATHEQ